MLFYPESTTCIEFDISPQGHFYYCCRHSEMGFPACHPAVIAINMTEENKLGETEKISLDSNVQRTMMPGATAPVYY